MPTQISAAHSLQDVFVFVQIILAGSMTNAGNRLGISPSAASKSLRRLEARLGLRLVNRTTRAMSLTDDGAVFFERCRKLLADLDNAEDLVAHRSVSPRGRLRIQVPSGFGRSILVPLLAEFADRHRALTLDVELSDRAIDLVEEGVEVVVWIGERCDSTLIAKTLCPIDYVTVASPKYLAAHGVPLAPKELADHRCLGFYSPRSNRYRPWTFSHQGKKLRQEASGGLNLNGGPALLEAAICGAGIARVASFLAAEAVRSGKLRLLLTDYAPPAEKAWIGYLAREHVSPRVRTLVDFLTATAPGAVSALSMVAGRNDNALKEPRWSAEGKLALTAP